MEDVFHWASNPSEDQRALLTSACRLLCLSHRLKERWSQGSGVATHTVMAGTQKHCPSVPNTPIGFHSHTFRHSLSMRRLFGVLQTMVNAVGLQFFSNFMRQRPLMSPTNVKMYLALNWAWSSINVNWVLVCASCVQPTTLHHT